jgi:hypothetical protein
MGYNTDFFGEFEIRPPLDLKHKNMLDDITSRENVYDNKQKCYKDGAPGSHCDWAVSREGNYLTWNGSEKFYDYVEWLNYLCKKVINPAGSFLVGSVSFQGEERDDTGVIYADKDDKRNQRIERVMSKIVEGTIPYWYIG